MNRNLSTLEGEILSAIGFSSISSKTPRFRRPEHVDEV